MKLTNHNKTQIRDGLVLALLVFLIARNNEFATPQRLVIFVLFAITMTLIALRTEHKKHQRKLSENHPAQRLQVVQTETPIGDAIANEMNFKQAGGE